MENNDLIDDQKNEVEQRYTLTNENRPESYYDNTFSEDRNTFLSSNQMNTLCKFDKSPTQTQCLTTTVPQNIGAQSIAGKHIPTRNSLRHSRMIVNNRSKQATDLPPLVKYYKFVKILLVLITFLGTVLCILSLLLLLWTANIRPRDNTYWSAVPVVFSGIIGFIFLYFFPKERSRTNLSYWIISIKFTSIAVSVIAATACFAMFAFAVIHLIALTIMTCSPPDKVNTTCLCKINSTEHSIISSYHYIDLSCTEVNDILYTILIFSCIINAIVGVSEILYLYFHWSSRTTYIYSRVQYSNYINKVNKGKR